MEYIQIQSFFTVLLGICGGVVGISGMVAVVVKFWKWAHKDTDRNSQEIAEFKEYLANDKNDIKRLEAKQDAADEQNRLMLGALIALLDHEIDGNNHKDQLEKSKQAITNYLVNQAVA